MGQGQSCYTGHTSSLSGEYLYQVWNGSLQWKESYCMVQCPIFWQSHEQIAKSWADDIEDKDPSNGRKTRMSRRKCHHLKSPRSLTVSSASRSCIVVVFYIRASYWLPSLSFHDNRVSHSWDTIWPWKFKVKGKGQMYPSQRSVLLTHFLSVSHQAILSTPVPFVPRHSGLPFPRYNLTLKIQGQRYPSQCSIQMTHFLSVSHQAIQSTPVPFVPWQ